MNGEREMKMRPGNSGFTLLELLAAIAIGSLMLIGLTSLADKSFDDAKAQQAALYQAQIVAAATQYIQTNYNDLISATANGTVAVAIDLKTVTPTPAATSALSGLTNPTAPTPPFLPPSIAATNSYGQAPCVIVTQPVAASNQLQALVVTYKTAATASAIGQRDLAFVAANAGAGGGYVITDGTGTIAKGATWSLSAADLARFATTACPIASGYLASAIFFNGPGQLSTDYLYRSAVGGHPELNKMLTPIVLAPPKIAPAAGQPCTLDDGSLAAIGAVTTDTNGLVWSCQVTPPAAGSVWQLQQGRYWRAPVADATQLPASGNEEGDVRVDLQDNVAYVWSVPKPSTSNPNPVGLQWLPLGVDQNGNLTLQGNLDASNNVISGTGRLTANDVNIQRQVVAGSVCTEPTGTLAIEAANPSATFPVAGGDILTCQNGVWNSQFSFANSIPIVGGEVVVPGPDWTNTATYTWANFPNNSNLQVYPTSGVSFDPVGGWSTANFRSINFYPPKAAMLNAQNMAIMASEQTTAQANAIPVAPQPVPIGGQFSLQAQLMDAATDTPIGQAAFTRSNILRNEVVAINSPIITGLPYKATGYYLQFVVKWITWGTYYTGPATDFVTAEQASNLNWTSCWGAGTAPSYCDIPLWMSYTINFTY
jgi:prepilin-type N-terminal cleavage/methylation domain-containing protein